MPFDTVSALDLPDSARTSWVCAIRLPSFQRLATTGLATILATIVWIKPFTPLAIEPEKVDSSELSLVSPRATTGPRLA